MNDTSEGPNRIHSMLGRCDKDQVKPRTPKQLLPTPFAPSHTVDLLYAPSVVRLILLTA